MDRQSDAKIDQTDAPDAPRHFPASPALTAALRAPQIMQGPAFFPEDESVESLPRVARVSFGDLDTPLSQVA